MISDGLKTIPGGGEEMARHSVSLTFTHETSDAGLYLLPARTVTVTKPGFNPPGVCTRNAFPVSICTVAGKSFPNPRNKFPGTPMAAVPG
jgi:hypothetical protein